LNKDRLTAFTDGVIAIIITIMVLEFKVPANADWSGLVDLMPTFLSYLLSFIYIGIYWNNHHHMMQTVHRVNGAILWANMHLLFWLSLVPFTTAWLGHYPFAVEPTALYGVSLFCPAIAYTILQATILHGHGQHSQLAQAIGRDWKGKASLLAYAGGIALAFFQPVLADGLYLLVAMMWLLPDPRIEKLFKAD
jgi:uncharacterized membrane protein